MSFKKITFHVFPSNPERRAKWIEIMKLQKKILGSNSRLCSLHFEEKFIDRTSVACVRLNENAIPHIFEDTYSEKKHDANIINTTNELPLQSLENIQQIDKQRTLFTYSMSDKQTSSSLLQETTLTDENTNILTEIICNSPKSTRNKTLYSEIEMLRKHIKVLQRKVQQKKEINATSSTYDKAINTSPSLLRTIRKSTQDKETSISPRKLWKSPTKCAIREENKKRIKSLQKEIYNLRKKLAKKDKAETLNNILNKLKQNKFLNDKQYETLHKFDKANLELFQRQSCKLAGVSMPKQYSPELRTFALTLHYYSPRAYNYVRNKFHKCLPHSKTLSVWYTSINGSPGINIEALNCIKEKAALVDFPLYACITFDEMAIRQQVEYDGSKYYGYVDFGSDSNSNRTLIAKEVLVFLLTCLNQNWKIPIAYYFIKGINAEEKKNLLLNCIFAVHQYNIKIVAVTFDGLQTNFRMACLLGANFNINSFQTWFLLPNNTSDKIFIFLDPSHLIKIIRNVFEKKGMMDAMDNIISWQYIKELHLLQEKEGLHIANKLRSIHVNFFKQKMKVRLAAQTLSKSVADAMQFCNTLKLPQFKGCEATIYFIRLINDLFDIFNSRNMKQYNYKAPINSNNRDIIYAKLNECFKYICGLKESRHENLFINSPKKVGFLGFCISIKSLMGLYDMLCEEPNSSLQYICTYKLSQDHLELLFSIIRQQFGCNNNPSAKQFQSPIKKICFIWS